MVRLSVGDASLTSAPAMLEPVLITRLKKRPDFLRVAAGRKKWVAGSLILQVRRWPEGEGRAESEAGIRVGFTVSRKVGNAVRRNRVRRRLRAAADRMLPEHAKAGRDFVIIGRAGTFGRPFGALLNDLKTALKKMNAYR